MIDQILKDHKTGEKPRFFLHDEMKAWLADNLVVTATMSANHSIDYDLQNKLGLQYSLTSGFSIVVSTSIAGEFISVQPVQVNLTDHERAFRCLTSVSENCMAEITRLGEMVRTLHERLLELEKK